MVEAGGKALPEARHLDHPATSGGSQAVILARMPGIGLDPLRTQQAFVLQAAQEGIDGSFRNVQPGAIRQLAHDLQSIEPVRPKCRQDGEFKTPFAQLDFPLVSRLSRRRDGADSHR